MYMYIYIYIYIIERERERDHDSMYQSYRIAVSAPVSRARSLDVRIHVPLWVGGNHKDMKTVKYA